MKLGFQKGDEKKSVIYNPKNRNFIHLKVSLKSSRKIDLIIYLKIIYE